MAATSLGLLILLGMMLTEMKPKAKVVTAICFCMHLFYGKTAHVLYLCKLCFNAVRYLLVNVISICYRECIYNYCSYLLNW